MFLSILLSACRGYYPKGGGEVRIFSSPLHILAPLDLTSRGELTRVTGRAFVAGTLPIRIAHTMAEEANRLLRWQLPGLPCHIEVVKEQQVVGNGTGIM